MHISPNERRESRREIAEANQRAAARRRRAARHAV
jgi:hypothetical protein